MSVTLLLWTVCAMSMFCVKPYLGIRSLTNYIRNPIWVSLPLQTILYTLFGYPFPCELYYKPYLGIPSFENYIRNPINPSLANFPSLLLRTVCAMSMFCVKPYLGIRSLADYIRNPIWVSLPLRPILETLFGYPFPCELN